MRVGFASIVTLFGLNIPLAEAQTYFLKNHTSVVSNAAGDSRSVNWVDIDNDRDLDLFVSNGKEGGENNFLYINDGKGNFTAVVNSQIVQDSEPSDGATWADYDNDGDMDAYVVNWYNRTNMLYNNTFNGNSATFSRVMDAPMGTDKAYSETASWGDYDSDGDVDLYVTNSAGTKKNALYNNKGNGTFTKVTTGPMVTDAFVSRSVSWVDYDMDGDVDLFVTNEENQHENLYRNTNGTFEKITTDPLVNNGGKTMSASWGDYDNDGLPDVFLANDGGNDALFHNEGNGTFKKINDNVVTTAGGNSFGSQWADINNDGWLDLYVTNSFWGDRWTNFLFINNGDGSFTRNTSDVSATETGWSYGCAFGDTDRDGDLDLAVAKCYNAIENNALYLNQSSTNGNRWLVVSLEGVQSNRSAIGAKVWLKARIDNKEVTQYREITAQSGYCGQNQLAAHFGLGRLDKIESLTIQWPSGIEQVFGTLPPDQYIYVKEGESISATNEVPNLAVPKVIVTPNPFDDTIHVVVQNLKTAKAEILLFDQNGKLVKTHQVKNQADHEKMMITTGSLTPGMYIITCKTGTYTFSQKLIKK